MRCIIVVLLVLACPARGTTATLSETVDAFARHYPLNGVVLVARGSRLLWHRAYGYADVARGIAIDPNATFAIASLTKQFTAAAALQLAAAGRLDLHAPIATYLPATHPIWRGKAPAWAARVTAHHLLTHSSGIADYLHVDQTVDVSQLDPADAVAAIVAYVARRPLEFTPGSKFSYNNSGYVLCGVLIEAISGEDATPYFARHLFAPANMWNSFLLTPAQELNRTPWPTVTGTRPQRYEVARLTRASPLMTAPPSRVLGSTAGAVIASAADLWRWTAALHRGDILPAPVVTQMLHPYQEVGGPGMTGYAYGIMVGRTHRGTPLYRHGGSLNGVRAELRYAPQEHITTVVLTNVSPANGGSRKNNPLARFAADLEDAALIPDTAY